MAVAATHLEHLDTTDSRTFKHVPGLDGFRAFAVLFVMCLHYGTLYNRKGGGAMFGGFVGVDIFFVLSGFLITSLLVREKAETGGVSFKNFYARRALRLLPAVVGFLVAHTVYVAITSETTMIMQLKRCVYVLLYVSNFAQSYWDRAMVVSGMGLTWSLSIEEQFYMVWPAVLLFVLLRYCKRREHVLWAIGAAALVSLLIRTFIWHFMDPNYPAAYMNSFARGDGLLLGAMCAFLWRWRMVPLQYLNQAAVACSAALVAIVVLWPRENVFMFAWGGFTLVSIAAGIVILAIAENRFSLMPIFEWAPLRVIGRVSYGLYLFHGLGLRIAARNIDPKNAVACTLLGLFYTAIFVSASWFLIEQPFLRVKKRFSIQNHVP
jgi:peptidoglycan/LPS O-acetylase OafA/YrhL